VISKSTKRITEIVAADERSVASINACLVAAIIHAIIKVYRTLLAADRSHRSHLIFFEPSRREHQSSSQDCEHEDLPHKFRKLGMKHGSTPPYQLGKANEHGRARQRSWALKDAGTIVSRLWQCQII
jgi:hypothetical protein